MEKMYTESVLNFIPAGTVLVVNDQEFATTNAEEVQMQAIGLDNDLKQQYRFTRHSQAIVDRTARIFL
ncbi:hypothetical protein AABM34_01090 [Lysinibacillus fusiformis]